MKVNVQLCLAENIRRFIATIGKYDYPMDLWSGKCVVNARSILGIFSLDLSRPVTLDIRTDPSTENSAKLHALMEDLKPFMAAASC